MPRFQIKRKTRKPEPEVVPEEKIDENEMSLESSSESEDETKPLNKQMETLELDESPEDDTETYNEPEYVPKRRSRSASVAHMFAEPVRNQYPRAQRPPQARRMYREPRPIEYARPSRSVNGRRVLQYRSSYGPNGEHMSTQDKARSLYYSCFG